MYLEVHNGYLGAHKEEKTMSKLTISGIWQAAELREKAIIVVGLLYVLSPIDIVPEVVLGPLGLLDDGGALLAVVFAVTAAINRQKQSRSNIINGEEVKR